MPSKRALSGLLAVLLVLVAIAGHAKDGLSFSCQFPYYLGKARDSVAPGTPTAALFSIENRNAAAQEAVVTISLPPGFQPAGTQANWEINQSADRYVLTRNVLLAGGYSQWYDLLSLQVAADLPPGRYQAAITAGTITQQVPVTVTEGKGNAAAALTIAGIVLPLDKDGKTDERMGRNTLVLRDRQWDYYKNLLAGKGASNQEIEAIHPVTHLGVDIANSAGVQKLVVVTVRLLDAVSHQPVNGLFTPGATNEDVNGGALDSQKNYLEVFTAINGDERQRLQIPVYADERDLTGGDYLLQAELHDGVTSTLVYEAPLTVVKKDNRAMAVVSIAVLAVLAGLFVAVRRLRQVLTLLKTRWLVTIALFGAAAFAIVTVPSTLANDFFHIVMGPFSVLITGLFSGVFLYMMVVALIILIPRPGVVALMTIVRMLLGMLAFGQVSPISLLSYSLQALLLEIMIYGSGMYSWLQKREQDSLPVGKMLLLAVSCGAADMISTYVGLQAMAFLYRLYYAAWYIGMVLVINGFIYTAVGAVCGMFLGNRLARVGGD
ncbi:hypothetical protein [Sporomusa acidovorans]|uniref:Uncharacterized protein n=1 Tax=Sporomusa acidovorans (strain ATCC 49682 / DSM 3132 / Mol) TaxID=1123286 RepID=A0ABZ3IYM2_SPOA4|nr:hypothetical protein [Sporomusa acidovorans]OZC17675.1 hypothetical protein SPACI_36790 [Sporomusa acidovorans DSM 3132]SDE11721.1 hypothetical protein SAMN04488499_100855 [Sporomusa acidovorans]